MSSRQAGAAVQSPHAGHRHRLALLSGVLLLGIAAALLRRPDVVRHPALFAEDGTIFMNSALTQSFPSAFTTPYAGYLHATPRIIASVASLLPLAWTPAVYTMSATVVGALAMAPAVSARLSWLMPSVWVRCALFLALVLLPGVEDVHGVIANLQWWFGITLVLLALSDDARTWAGRIAEPVALAVIGLTGPFSILTAPLFWIRLWRRRTRESLVAAAVVTAAALIQAVVVLLSHYQGGHPGPVGLGGLANAWILRYGGTAVFGQATLRSLYLDGLLHGAFWVITGGFLVLTAVAALRLPLWAWISLMLGALGGIASATLRLRGDVLALGDPVNGGRYYVIPLGMLAIALVAAVGRGVVDRAGPPRWTLLLAAVPASLMLLGAVLDNQLPGRADIHWDASVQCMQSHQTCVVPVDPPGWEVTIPPL